MKIDYDKKADALYVKFRTVPIRSTILLRDNIVLDLDSNRKIVGIEVLDVNKQVGRMKNIEQQVITARK